MDWAYFLDLFMSGLTKGSIYALIALGYTMVYGIIQLINFAHGEIYMIGAFVALITATILASMGLNIVFVFLLSTLVAVIYSSAYGFTVEKIAYKPLRHASRLSPLISAIGMSIFLQNYVMLSQTADFVPFPEIIPVPSFLEKVADYVDPVGVVIIVVTVIVMIGLHLFVKKTKMGKAMRATAQNKTMAMLCGVDVDKTISLTFIIGSALAAIGGVLIGSYVGQINFFIGFIAGLKAFTAAVLGGIGSIPGAALGGVVLGLTESFGTGYISSDYEDVFAFIILVLILIFRPAGILGKSNTEKV